MRINQMITKEKMLCPFIEFSQLISKEVYEYRRLLMNMGVENLYVYIGV